MILRIMAAEGGGARAITAMLIYTFMACAYKHSVSFSTSPTCVHESVCVRAPSFFLFRLWLSYSEPKAELFLPVNTHQRGISCTDNWTKSRLKEVKIKTNQMKEEMGNFIKLFFLLISCWSEMSEK